VQQDYFSDLLPITKEIERLVRLHLLPALQPVMDEQRAKMGFRVDSPPEDIESIVKSIRAEFAFKFTEGFMRTAADKAGESSSNVNRKQVTNQMRSVGVNVFQDTPNAGDMLKDFTRTNVKLIKSLPDTAFTRIEDIVQRGLATGARHGTLAKDIAKEFDVTRRRAKLIARDQVSKLNSQITRQRHKANGVTKEIWRTMGDERVRPEHEAREGQEYSVETGIEGEFPGDPINCRCYAEPVLGD